MTRSAIAHRRQRHMYAADSCNRADSTTVLGATDGVALLGDGPGWLDPLTWVQQSAAPFFGTGGWGILSNQAYTPAGAGNARRPVATVGPTYADVEVTLRLANRSNQCGVVFRWVDGNNYWYVLNWANSTQTLLVKVIAGAETVVTSAPATVLSSGQSLKVVAVGSSIRVYRVFPGGAAPTLLLTATDAALATATHHGMLTQNEFTSGNGGDAGARLDDFVVVQA